MFLAIVTENIVNSFASFKEEKNRAFLNLSGVHGSESFKRETKVACFV
jgi:hypothetical protein